jgi:Cu-Zn family superoxide dismutase
MNMPSPTQRSRRKALLFIFPLLVGGCLDESPSVKTAVVTLAPTAASPAARGTVRFTEENGGVRVQASLQGLPPGLHGFHVHEKGSCDSAGLAAGGHFNPEGHIHGYPDSLVHHMGDLGNLDAGADSTATLNQVFSYLRLDGVNTIVGHALIVHAKVDDGGQPLGNAGARISCAVIGAK